MEDLTQFDYLQALEELEYLFEGVTIPFVLLGETARRVRGVEDLKGLPAIEIGILKRTMSDYADRTLRDKWGVEWKNNTHKVKNVPVHVKFIERKYSFFDNPDQKTYYGGIFMTANPFEKYWKIRNLIK